MSARIVSDGTTKYSLPRVDHEQAVSGSRCKLTGRRNWKQLEVIRDGIAGLQVE